MKNGKRGVESFICGTGVVTQTVPGQCGGMDTQSRGSRLSRLTDLRRACSSEAAAVILGAKV